MNLFWDSLNLSWHALGYFAIGILGVAIIQSTLSDDKH